MIRFSYDTFVRYAGGRSLLWRPRMGACVVLADAEPFLRHIGWSPRSAEEIAGEIAADFGVEPEEVAEDVREFIAPLAEDGFITAEVTENTEAAPRGGAEDLAAAAPSAANFDADGNGHDDSWTPLGDFYRESGLPVELHLDLTAASTERCVHCYIPDYPNKHIPFALAEKALREFQEMQGLTVHLTGGECMLHPEFVRAWPLVLDHASGLPAAVCGEV